MNYQVSEEFSVYGRIAQGYKAGGINMDRSAPGQAPGAPTPDPDGTHFDPETVDSFEIGFKSRLLDNTLTLNGAVFYQELEDYQQNSFDGLNFTVRNAATVEGKGVEFDYMYAPNERWLFSGGVTFQNIEYGEFENASPTAWQGTSVQDLSGKPVLFTSDTTLAGLVSYTLPINDDLNFIASTTYSYSSEYFTGQDNDPITEQDDYWIFNLNFSVAATDDSWQVDLWGKNVGDEEIYNIVFDTPLQSGSYHAYIREPMSWGMTGKLRF
ncbi:MAG: TonB-dependent receptor domain-containing protein [Cellvibrionaceae bacterium]